MKITAKGNFMAVYLISFSLLYSVTVSVMACPPDPPPPGSSELPPSWPATGAEPIYLPTGEFYTTATDLVIRGRVLQVEIVRTYRSQKKTDFGFGYCWDLNYNIKIEKVGDYWLVLYDGKLRKLNYVSMDGGTTFEGPPGYYDSIKAHGGNGNGPYTLTKKHGIKQHFDIEGKLTQITDRTGNNKINFMYAGNQLRLITDDLDRTITLQYNAEGHLRQITDFSYPPRTWEYEYIDNDLHCVKLPETEEYGGLDRRKICYTYDYDHNLEEIKNPKDWMGTYLHNTYTDGRVTSQTYGDGDFAISYNPDYNRATVIDRKGYYTEIEYNSTGNPIRRTRVNLNPYRAFTTYYEYNSNSEMTRVIFPKGNCIDFTYDNKGKLKGIYRKTSPSGSVISTTFTYESAYDFVKTITDPRGNVTTFTYDYEEQGNGVGNLLKITSPTTSEVSFTYNEFGQIETVTSPDEIITKFEYYNHIFDGYNYGRLKKVIRDYDAEGLNITTLYEYDKWGKVNKVTDPGLNTWELTHDELELLKQIKAPSPFDYITKFSYDENKKLTKLQAQLGSTFDDLTAQTTLLGYNVLDHLTQITNPLGNNSYFEYDRNENLNQIKDPGYGGPIPYWTDFEHDERNLLRKAVEDNTESFQLQSETKFQYDNNGNLWTIEDAHQPQGYITMYDHDLFDRLKTITYIGYIYDDYYVTEVFNYDASSNVISWKNRKDQYFYFQYDALNRLKEKSCPDGQVVQYEYDLAGRLKKVNDSDKGITEYSYDRLGRIEEVKSPDGKTIGYSYDAMSRRTQMTYPDDSVVTYEYDALSRLKKVKYNGSTLAEYDYDELSRRTKVTLNNGTETIYDYQDKVEEDNDNFGNNIEKLTHNFNGGAKEEFIYTYNSVGSVSIMNMSIHCPPQDPYDMIYQCYSYTLDTPTEVYYIYDWLDSVHVLYNYDKVGNRETTQMVNGTNELRCYTMNSKGLNQYDKVSVYGSPGYSELTYTYDDNGNLTGIDRDDDIYYYDYDCENRLIEARKNSQTLGEYTYDFTCRRVTRAVDGTTTKYYYDGGQVIAEYEGSTLVRKYIYGPGIDEPIRIITTTGSYYYHYDRLGSVVALSGLSGYIEEGYSYDVFGQFLVHTAPGSDGIWMTGDDETDSFSAKGNPYTFSGRRYDLETGLYYYRFRHYDPRDGRFMQNDPVGYAGGFNLYTYCGNNPFNWIDPWGLYGRSSLEFSSSAWWDWTVEIGCEIGRGALEGVELTVFGATAGLLGDDDSIAALRRRYPVVSQLSTACGGVSTVCVGSAAAIQVLSLDVALWGGSTATTSPEVQEGMQLWRMWGGSSGPSSPGTSTFWCDTNPLTVPNYHQAAQLPVGNTGEFISTGTLVNTSNVIAQPIVVGGALTEIIAPHGQVIVQAVSSQ